MDECNEALLPLFVRLYGLFLLFIKAGLFEQGEYQGETRGETRGDTRGEVLLDLERLLQKENKMALVGLYGHQDQLEILNEEEDLTVLVDYWKSQLLLDFDLLAVFF